MNFLRGLLCRFRGHRWGRAFAHKELLDGARPPIVFKSKACKRCGLVVPVKRRAK